MKDQLKALAIQKEEEALPRSIWGSCRVRLIGNHSARTIIPTVDIRNITPIPAAAAAPAIPVRAETTKVNVRGIMTYVVSNTMA